MNIAHDGLMVYVLTRNRIGSTWYGSSSILVVLEFVLLAYK